MDQLVPAVRAIIRQADPRQPVSDIGRCPSRCRQHRVSRSPAAHPVVFAAIATLLAAVGLHGLLSFTVSQRTPEIGVRMALGAQRRDILVMVLKHAAWLTGLGLVPGIALAYAAGRSLQALLAGVAPADPFTFAAATVLTILMAFAGMLLPTLRAVRVDAIRAIRTNYRRFAVHNKARVEPSPCCIRTIGCGLPGLQREERAAALAVHEQKGRFAVLTIQR